MKMLEAEGSSHLHDFAKKAIATAKLLKGRRFVMFNGIVFWVKPDDNVNAVAERYHRALERLDKQYLKSQKRRKRR